MLSASIAYQVLRQENPPHHRQVKEALEKHPSYANHWQARLQDVSVADHGLVLFIQAARWADDIRTQDKAQNRPLWSNQPSIQNAKANGKRAYHLS
jgi:hypothetical protein